MFDDYKLSELPVASSLNLTDYMTLLQSGANKIALLSVLKALLLEGKTIGGSAAGDIADIDSIQQFTNKLLSACSLGFPYINSESVQCNVTSEDINKIVDHLDGSDYNHAAEHISFSSIHGSNVDDALSGLLAAVATLVSFAASKVSRTYALQWTQSGTTKTITEATILAALGVTNYVVLPSGFQIQLWTYDGVSKSNPATGVTIGWYETEVNGQMRLDEVVLGSLTNAQVYKISISCLLAQETDPM